ncbi:MAG: transcription antitermination factor NusB [Desulfuromonadales bacterium]|nr:transcription antitermination factor NusB [Desulfuromonadales bacterium]MDT8422334.1 transcription antitermination factor NusB [Desulfuromonadales bacterium]
MSQGVRRYGRELALKVLFGLHDLVITPEQALADFWRSFRFDNDVLGEAVDSFDEEISGDVRDFAEQLVRGVVEHLEKIDAAIERAASNWTLQRMARVDLALLRLGTYELLYCDDIPVSVSINEAIEIGKRFGTKETPGFVNGILDKISKGRSKP